MHKNVKKIAVVYHGGCPDGFSGAWVAWQKFGSKAEYIGALDRKNPPANLTGREVYLIDYTWPIPVMQKLKLQAKKLVAIDHHISQADSVKISHEHRFSLDRSGAVLAWRYFFPKAKAPALLKYIEDYDLWIHKYSDTAAVHSLVNATPFDFKSWSRLSAGLEKKSSAKELLAQGRVVLAAEGKAIQELLGYAYKVKFDGKEVMAINSPVFNDQLGNILYRKHPPLAIVWRTERDRIHVSLRSDGSVDVSKIAEKYGGAGHRAAAGFSFPADQAAPWKPIGK